MQRTSNPIPRRLFLAGALASAALPLLARTAAAPEHANASPSAAGALRSAASLGPLVNIPQTIEAVLRPDGVEVGMTQYGVPAYTGSLGIRTLVGAGGTETLVKRLVAAGFPVIVHQLVSLADPVGHWRPIEAYDDARGVFTASAPYLGAGHQISYADFAQMWATRGFTFMVLYPLSKQSAVSAVLNAAGWNKRAAYTHDLALVLANQIDVIPTGATAAAGGYRALAAAWDNAQLGHLTTARAYLQQASGSGINPTIVGGVGAAIG